jgi:hypothetical protein
MLICYMLNTLVHHMNQELERRAVAESEVQTAAGNIAAADEM